MQDTHRSSHRHHFLALGLALLLMLLAACGTNVAGTTTGSNGSTGNPGATASATGATVAENCGAVHTARQVVVPADTSKAPGIEDCFWQAYQQCHAATLSYVQGSVDTAQIHTFTLKSQNNQCVITDALQSQVVPRPAKPVGTYTCTGLTRANDGLHFSACGNDGDVVVPTGGTQ
jgi:hypothetical protein